MSKNQKKLLVNTEINTKMFNLVGSENLKQKRSLQQRMLSLYLLSCYRQKNPLKQEDNNERTYNGKNFNKKETIDANF